MFKQLKNLHILLSFILIAISVESARAANRKPSTQPNIIFVMADDAGIGDYGCYGGKNIKTPIADRMAREGMKFTRAYSGSAVCAPTRSVLMTGLHTGHCLVRANRTKDRKRLALAPGTTTVASILKKAGYATGGFGKWGLGNPGTTGVPEKQGFDIWFGYYDQRHAHDYYTDHLILNSKKYPLPKNANGKKGTYTQDVIEAETLKFIKKNKDRPFFVYAAWTPPHGKYVIPKDDPNLIPYKKKDWKNVNRNYAAMVTKLDTGVGKILDLVKELKIDDNTIVIYTSDNGTNQQFIKPLKSSGGLRGYKRLLYEGGIRAPFIVRWPGMVKPSTTSDLLSSHVDLLATATDLAGAKIDNIKTDGISIIPTLLGKQQTNKHSYLYFEIYESRFQQSVRQGMWKGYRLGLKSPLELYNLSNDRAEKINVADQYPDIVKQLEAIMAKEHSPSPHFDAIDKPKKKQKRNKKNMKKMR